MDESFRYKQSTSVANLTLLYNDLRAVIPAKAAASLTKPQLAHVHSVNVSPYFASRQGEESPLSPKGSLRG